MRAAPIALVLIAVAFLGAGVKRRQIDPRPLAPIAGGDEITLVLILSTGCAGVRERDFALAVDRIRNGLRQRADSTGKTFSTIGVSTDRLPESGIRLLNRFGPFDEMSVGRSWLNGAVLKYVWTEHPGEAGVPQIVVLERRVEYGQVVGISAERVVVRKTGWRNIVAWGELVFGNEPLRTGSYP